LTCAQMEEVQRLRVAMQGMYTQEHVDRLEREVQKANLLLIKVQSKWQQAQLAAGVTQRGGEAEGWGKTPRPDWQEVQEQLPQLQVTRVLMLMLMVMVMIEEYRAVHRYPTKLEGWPCSSRPLPQMPSPASSSQQVTCAMPVCQFAGAA
jgi:hypothetical protein